MSATALQPPLSVDRPEEWLDVPITKPEKISEKFLGWTYRKLGLDEGGREYLAKRAREGAPPDVFAKKVLTEVLPHAMVCACNACKILAPSPLATTVTTAAPAPTPPHTGAMSDPTAARGATEMETPVPVPVPSQGGAPEVVTSEGKKRGVRVPKRPRSAADDNAAVEAEAVRRRLEVDAPRSRILCNSEDEEDRRFLEDSEAADPLAASVKAKFRREDVLKKLATELTIDDARSATWAAREITSSEDELERVKRECAILVARAERRFETRKAVLMPKLEAWAKTADRASEKTVRLPGWIGRLTYRWQDESVEIQNEREAMQAVIAKIGIDRAIDIGVVRVREELSKSGLSAHVLSTRETLAGTQIVPAGDKLVIYRK